MVSNHTILLYRFSIARDSDRLRQFKIVRKDQFSAEVRIRQPLDRETISSYNLRILAIDGGQFKKMIHFYKFNKKHKYIF